MQRPRLAAFFQPHLFPPADVVLLGEVGHAFIDSRALVKLAPYLDGRHEMDALMDLTAAELSPAELWYTVMQGEADGWLRDAADDEDDPASRAFWDCLEIGGASARRRFTEARIRLHAIAPVDLADIRDAFLDAAIGVEQAEWDVALEVAVVDDYLRPELLGFNARMLASGQPWMPLRPTGGVVWIGPVFRPGTTGCLCCLTSRLQCNREIARFVEQKAGRSLFELVPSASNPASRGLAGRLAALEVMRLIAGAPQSTLEGRLMTYDLASGAVALHEMVRRPQCSACGDGRPLPEQAPRLGPTPRLTPAELQKVSLDRLRRQVDPITGIIQSSSVVGDPVSLLMHHVNAVHEFPMVREDIRVLADNAHGRSGGAGLTEEDAEIGALGEAVERISGIWRGEEEVVRRASQLELGEAALDVSACLLYSASQYSTSAEWNPRQTAARALVPRRLESDEAIDWTAVWSLTSGKKRYLPAAFCYYGHPDATRTFCYSDSNGCAAGPSLEAAVRAGLMELIERDAVAVWWYNRIKRPALDLASFDLPLVRRMEDYYRRLGRDLIVLDLTHDLGIPVFAAQSARHDHAREEIILGFGADLDPRVALARALRELTQFHPLIAERGDGGRTIYRTGNQDAIRWLAEEGRGGNPHLLPAPGRVRALSDFADQPPSDPHADIAIVTRVLAAAGIDAYVLDQTRPDIGIAVARTIAPGLRHFWRRLAPGRLYDVPVALGWLDKPRCEAEINPLSIFF